MSAHYEWAGVDGCPINIVAGQFDLDLWSVTACAESLLPGEHFVDTCECNDERTTSGPSIVLGGDNGMVIEAETKDQLVEFARTLLRMAEDADIE